MTTKNLLVSATNVGLDLTFVADILAKWGPDVLQLIIDGLRFGLTKDLLWQILNILGKDMLRTVVLGAHPDAKRVKLAAPRTATCCMGLSKEEFDRCCPELVTHEVPVSPFPIDVSAGVSHPVVTNLKAFAAPIIEGEQVDSLAGDTAFVQLIIQLLPKLLPALLSNPEVLKAVIEAVLGLFQKKAHAVAQALAD